MTFDAENVEPKAVEPNEVPSYSLATSSEGLKVLKDAQGEIAEIRKGGVIVYSWEAQLVEDCQRIIRDAEVGIFKKWHELGSRVKQDESFLTKEYGDKWYIDISSKIGMSYQSLYQSIQFIEKFPTWNNVEDFLTRQKMSWRDFVHKMLPDKTREMKPAMPIPEGKYRCIVIDPPWPMQKIEREVRPNQTQELDYPTITLEEIANLPIADKADSEGCHVYLWFTHKFMHEALHLFEKWGVKYQCQLTWNKNVGFTPFSWMYNTEHVLFGRVGSLELLQNGLRLGFNADVREHSRKPNEFYDLVRMASPAPRIDFFAREKHEGFETWGNEPDRF